MEKFNGKSMDLVQENIKKLKEIFPEAFVEGKVNFDVLRQIFGGGGVDTSKERYSLNWNGKSRAIQLAQEVSTGTLRPVKEESKNWDNTENIYIEGDNLEVLKLLQKSYYGKIKMIYIDPPYNTGKDFVYKDNFKDNLKNYLEVTGQVGEGGVKLTTNAETSGRYHSDWLSMMYPRLKLARNLLTDDGVIFISIDDNEQANLKKICDEIFGEENFVAEFIWNSTKTPNKTRNNIGKNHEYIICYTKNDKVVLNLLQLNKEDLENYKNKDEFFNKKGPYKLVGLNKTGTVTDLRPNLTYLIEAPDGTLIKPNPRWRWSKETFNKNKNENRVVFSENKGKWTVYYKQYLNENNNGETIERGKLVETILRKIGTTSNGTDEMNKLIGRGIFDFPKPTNLIEHFGVVGTEKNSIVLDFFSGSSTTAHSVMQLNAEDGGNRKYIMVQLPELCEEDKEAYKAGYKNICEIGKERIRRAGDKIKEDETLPLENREKLDIGFRVFKLDSSNIKEWDTDTNDLQQSLLDSVENIKSDRSSLDVLYEILLKYGLDLNVPIKETENFYSIGGGTLLVSLNNEINLDVINSICEEYKKILEINKEFKTTVILRDNSFKNDVDKTNAIKKLEQVGISEIRSI